MIQYCEVLRAHNIFNQLTARRSQNCKKNGITVYYSRFPVVITDKNTDKGRETSSYCKFAIGVMLSRAKSSDHLERFQLPFELSTRRKYNFPV